MVPCILRFFVVNLSPCWSEDHRSLPRIQVCADSVSVPVKVLVLVRNLKLYGLTMISLYNIRVLLESDLHQPIDSDAFLVSKLRGGHD